MKKIKGGEIIPCRSDLHHILTVGRRGNRGIKEWNHHKILHAWEVILGRKLHLVLLIRDGSIRDSTGIFEKNRRQQCWSRKNWETNNEHILSRALPDSACGCYKNQSNFVTWEIIVVSLGMTWKIMLYFCLAFLLLGKSKNKAGFLETPVFKIGEKIRDK